MPKSDVKIVVFGIDGACWSIIDLLIGENKLPNLKRLIDTGTSASLRAFEPILSPVIWTSISSGKLPDKHGIRDFHNNYDSVKCKRIWDILNERGYKVGVYSHLLTWPPKEVNGFMVPGFLASDTRTYPPELSFVKKLSIEESAEKKTSVRQYLQYVLPGLTHGASILDFIKAALFLAKNRLNPMNFADSFYRKRFIAVHWNFNIFRHLYKKYQSEYAFFYTSILDACSHFYWRFFEPNQDSSGTETRRFGNVIYKAYEKVDKIIGKFVRSQPDDTIYLVLSDHGFQSAAAKSYPHTIIKAETLLQKMNLLDKFYATQSSFKLYLRKKKKGGSDEIEKFADLFRTIKLEQTGERLFAVDIDEYKTLCISIRPENYLPLTEKTLNGKTVILPSGKYEFEELVRETDELMTGTHHIEGILILNGPPFKSGYRLEQASVVDITPTLLYLFGMPTAKDMDGKVLMGAIDEDYQRNHPVTYIATYEEVGKRAEAAEEELELSEQVKARLKELGYLS